MTMMVINAGLPNIQMFCFGISAFPAPALPLVESTRYIPMRTKSFHWILAYDDSKWTFVASDFESFRWSPACLQCSTVSCKGSLTYQETNYLDIVSNCDSSTISVFEPIPKCPAQTLFGRSCRLVCPGYNFLSVKPVGPNSQLLPKICFASFPYPCTQIIGALF